MNPYAPMAYHCTDTIDELPQTTTCFENFFINDSITICENRENVSTILSIKSNVSIIKMELCQNTVEIKDSYDLTKAYVLRLEIKVSFQIKYVGGPCGKNVFVENTHIYKIIYIPVPEYISFENIKDLYRKNKINAQVYVEDLQTITFDNKVISFSLLGLANISFLTLNNLIE